jgi:hypothetical protein
MVFVIALHGVGSGVYSVGNSVLCVLVPTLGLWDKSFSSVINSSTLHAVWWGREVERGRRGKGGGEGKEGKGEGICLVTVHINLAAWRPLLRFWNELLLVVKFRLSIEAGRDKLGT